MSILIYFCIPFSTSAAPSLSPSHTGITSHTFNWLMRPSHPGFSIPVRHGCRPRYPPFPDGVTFTSLVISPLVSPLNYRSISDKGTRPFIVGGTLSRSSSLPSLCSFISLHRSSNNNAPKCAFFITESNLNRLSGCRPRGSTGTSFSTFVSIHMFSLMTNKRGCVLIGLYRLFFRIPFFTPPIDRPIGWDSHQLGILDPSFQSLVSPRDDATPTKLRSALTPDPGDRSPAIVGAYISDGFSFPFRGLYHSFSEYLPRLSITPCYSLIKTG